MGKKRVLINVNSNLNYTAGGTTIISSLVNKYLDDNYKVTLISKYEVSNNFLRNIYNRKKFNYIDRLKFNNKIVNYIDNNHLKFDELFIKNKEILKLIAGKIWSNKIVSKNLTTTKYNFLLPKRYDNEIRLIYCGTLRDNENIIKIIEDFKIIHKNRPEVFLKIVYGKFHANLNFQNLIKKYIKQGVNGCEFIYNLSHEEACYEIAKSDIGISMHPNEKSIKVKEYKDYGLKVTNCIKYLIKSKSNKKNNIKYNFDLPKRNDNEFRLIYYGNLCDKENILEIIEEFQKIHKERPKVLLKIIYQKINGEKNFKDKLNAYIKNGIKGVTFKHNLSYKDSCYEIATSDIGICCLRKNGVGCSDEISTNLKEYKMYNLQIINDLKLKVGVVTVTNKTNKIENIIRNYKQQIYFNKKLFLVINNNLIKIEKVKQLLIDSNINYELIIIDKKFNLGYCLNSVINKMIKQKFDIFSKFDDDDIYEKKYLLEQVYILNMNYKCIVGKYNIPLFIPEHNKFYTIKKFKFNKINQFAEMCHGSTIMFNINDIKHNFDVNVKKGVVSIFLKQHISNGRKIYVTSFDNYIWIRYLDKNKHTYTLNINDFSLEQITDDNLIYKLYSNLISYKFIETSHLLVTIIVTMYNSSKIIEKCLQSMLNQTHKNVEIIVVDDASNDNSVDLVENIIKKNNKIKLIKNKENRGTYYCKNIALQSMNKNTKYIAYQDSDDFSHKERIRKQIEILYLTNGKLSITLCKRYNVLRFACVSQVYDIEIFNKLGYFDNSRFGADSEYLERFFNYYGNSLKFDYNYKNILEFFSNLKNCFLIPHLLYIINSNDENCITNINKLGSYKRRIYATLFRKKPRRTFSSRNSSLINYIPKNYQIEYTINSINNIITVKKEQFEILNSILITFELKNINKNINVFVNIYEDNNIFKNKLNIYKENNECYSYILIDNPNNVLSFDISIDNYKNVNKIKLKNVDYIYYYNNITKKIFLNNFPYNVNNLILTDTQINNFKFLTLKYDKYYLNSGIKPVKKVNTTMINLPNLELNILNKNPLISIIITCYNAENTIENAINSLLNQTYKNIEIIIVDDCSNDKSRNIINKFKNKDNIHIIFNKQNIKTYSSRNVALQYCSGDFITFQDADDISLYDRIEKQVNYSINNKCHINIGLCVRTNIMNKLNKDETKCNMFDKIINNIDTTNLINLPYTKRPHNALVTSFIHKSVFNDIGNFASLPCSGDAEFIERFLYKKYNLIFNESAFGNLSTLLSRINNIGSIHIIKEVLYIAETSDINLTSKYDRNFRLKLKKKYRIEYKKDNNNIKYIKLSENLLSK